MFGVLRFLFDPFNDGEFEVEVINWSYEKRFAEEYMRKWTYGICKRNGFRITNVPVDRCPIVVDDSGFDGEMCRVLSYYEDREHYFAVCVFEQLEVG